ncbi:AAA family ATPase [Agrobacterium vitis]|uniref:ATP-binding protein n=1 Tax=Rhizobium/Agrobacterium group TaxID=227290 RepID=UPI001F1FF334|nr:MULTISPECIES: AAA family ATPase [Rhizobium/Agrobacterium group]MCF1501705.1 AAA family ATPase [Allorhizobium sp. Av2]MCM2438509.1 AAA family ATPase [Agrobacterium vitis]MCM2473155.1 AAA family ATPase [Rhizobium sp. CG5]
MPRYYLTKLGVEGFRGIKNEGDPLTLRFKPDAVNSIYAQNGIGKTSLFEAISYAIFDKLPKLDGLQRSERPETYYVNRFHTGGVGSISLEFTPDDGTAPIEIVVQRTAAGQRTVTSPTGHTDPEAFLAALAEDFTVVDYAKFARFIDDSPLDRGRTFSSLIGLTRFAHLRQRFDQASNTRAFNTDFQMAALKAKLEAAEKLVRDHRAAALSAYEAVTGTAIQDLSAEAQRVVEVTAALAAIPTLAPVFAGKDILTVDMEAARAAIVAAEGGPAKAEYQKVLRNIEELSKSASTPEAAADIGALLDLARRHDAAVALAGSKSRQDLFGAAKGVVEEADYSDPHQCPVCDTHIEEPIATRMERLLERYREADQLGEEFKQAVTASIWLDWLNKLESCAALTVPDNKKHRASIRQLAIESRLTEGRLREAVDNAQQLEEERKSVLEAVQKREQELQAELPPSLVALTQQLEAGSRFREAILGHQTAAKEASAWRTHKKWRERWQTFIGTAARTVGEAESRLATQRINAIEASYQNLFRGLVRGGVDMRPKLERSADSEDVDLKLENFYGEAGISARAVLSESYRNAIAGSIFFAAAVKQSGPARFMVLDDITSSFDGGHQFALMEALRTKLQASAAADGLQFIVLSHDTLLEKYFDKTASEQVGWHHQRLQGAAPTGNVYASQLDANRLKNLATTHLQAGQVDIGQPFVRQYLEFKLSQIISKLKIPVPPDYAIRSDNKTVGNALDAISSAIDLFDGAGRIVLSAQQKTDFRNQHVPAIIANYVSHYETGGGTPINAHVLLGVLQSVDDLAECFRYDDISKTPPERKWYRNLGQQ